MEGTKGKEATAEAFRSPRILREFMSRFFANDSEHSNDQLTRILKSEETVSGTIRKHAMIALEAQLAALMTGSNISCAGGENLMMLLNVMQRAILPFKTSNHPTSLAFVEALLQFYLLHLVSLLTSNIRGSGTVPAFLPLLEDSDPLHLHLVRFTVKTLQKCMDYSSSAVSIFKELWGADLLAQGLQIEVHRVIGLADDSDSSMIIGGSSEDQLYSQEWLITASLKELGSASYTSGSGLEAETFPLIFGNNVVKFGGGIYHFVLTTLNGSIHNPTCFWQDMMSLPHAFISSVVAGVLPSAKALQCMFNALDPVCLDANGLEAVKERPALQMNGAIVHLANAVEELLWLVSWLRSIGVDITIEIATFTDNNSTGGKGNGIASSAAMDMQSEDKEQHLVDSSDDGISNDQFIKLSIFHLMVLVHTTMENAEICRLLVEKSGTHTLLLKLLLQPCVVQSCDGMPISVTSTSVFKDFTQNQLAAFASALKKKLSGVDVVSGSFLLEPRMSSDGGIFPNLMFLLSIAASKENCCSSTALFTELGTGSNDVGRGRVHGQISLLEDTGSTTESQLNYTEGQISNSFRQLFDPLLRRMQSVGSIESQYLSKQVFRHGTCIFVLRLTSGIMIGVDARAVSTWKAEGHTRTYETLVSDDTPKFIKVVDGVFATLCGSEGRMLSMLTYVRGEFNRLITHVDPRIGMRAFDVVCELASLYFKTIPKRQDEFKTTLHVLGWHPQEQNYVVFLVPDSNEEVQRLDSTYDGAGSGYSYVLETNGLENIHANMDIDAAVEFMKKGLIEAARKDRHSGGRLQVYALTNEGTLLETKYNKHIMMELEEEDMLSPESLKKTMLLIVEKAYEQICTPEDLLSFLDLKYKGESENDSVASVDWLGIVQNTWLVYQVEFNEEKVASRWYKDCEVWKKPMRHLEFSIAEGTCLCCVGRFSRVLLGRMRTMRSFDDLVSPF